MRNDRLDTNLRWKLGSLDSYMRTGPRDSYSKPRENPVDRFVPFFKSYMTAEDDELLGIYVNEIEKQLDCLLFTNLGIYSIDSRGDKFISYESIRAVEVPGDEDEDLDLALKSDEWVSISVRGLTEGERDIFAMYECIAEVISADFDLQQMKIKVINTREALISFADDNYLGSNFGDPEDWLNPDALIHQFKELDIDPEILKKRGIWRLFAMLLVR